MKQVHKENLGRT